MNRFQATLAGLSMGLSGLLLSLGAALMVDASRDALEARSDQADLVREIAELKDSVETTSPRDPTCVVAFGGTARNDQEVRLARIRDALGDGCGAGWRGRHVGTNASLTVIAPTAATVAATEEVSEELASVREAALTGDVKKIREAIAAHNATAATSGGTRVLLHDDPEVEKLGIAVRARYDHSSHFGVVLEANASSDVQEPVTVLVAPGTIVRASPGFQDTAPIQARFLKLTPRGHAEERATICCAMIHSEDPRATNPRGVVRHDDPRVARVVATAERTRADWGTAQVALWAVANDATRKDVRAAPGSYAGFIDGARDLLEKAGVDTNSLPLYQGTAPRHKTDALIDPGVRLGLQGG